MQRGREFLTDVPINFQTYEKEKVDINHVFPKASCKKREIASRDWYLVYNRASTPLGIASRAK